MLRVVEKLAVEVCGCCIYMQKLKIELRSRSMQKFTSSLSTIKLWAFYTLLIS